ncbi:NAD(P)-binding protein [Nadsonia fulvescens var. elongata DSM 6958]|uniref:NAD(P)-binding protein n=1 Tax=Nadsonia fulvescens var. elongata DSM 6958 TaxID=857566 RepID=A0A1E3PTY1_9ASCO|nr:NAD(P)-binding protein [Nadsonia fulvescens var. elongata DSM 6958]
MTDGIVISQESTAKPAVVPAPPTAEDMALAAAERPEAEFGPKDFMSKFRVDGKVAVVTGGARGLGFSMAEGLCSVGLAGIAIIDVQNELGMDACERLNRAYGVKALFYKVDIRDEIAVKETIDSVAYDLGSIDIVVNSAGVADLVHAEEYPSEKFRRVIDINLNGSFIVTQAAARHMIVQGTGGSVVFIASMSGSIVNWPQPQSAYNASKAGVKHLMKSLAAEWAVHKIRCNSISPGYMDTALNRGYKTLFEDWKSRTPLGRLGDPDELTGACIYLASEASAYCTGSDITIDGGYTII